MGRFDVYFDDEITKKLFNLANFEVHAKRLLKAAEPILVDEYKKQLRLHRETGSLYESIKVKYGKAKNGAFYIVARPMGKDKQKTPQRNMEKMMVLEFGTEGQPPRPILSTAMKNAEPKVIEALEREWNKIVNELGS